MDNKLGLSCSIIKKVSVFKYQSDALQYVIASHIENQEEPYVLSFINSHAFNLCMKEREFAEAILQSDLVLRDGLGIEILFNSIGVSPGANLNGSDFIPLLLDSLKGKNIAMIGTQNPFLDHAINMLKEGEHNIVLKAGGFLNLESYTSLIDVAKPDIIVLGMGMPKQEKLSMILKQELSFSCLIINGGAIIDFLGNRFTRAPEWVRMIKMEWLYRLIKEPKRLFKRYTLGTINFLLKVGLIKMYYYRNKCSLPVK